MFSRGWMLLKLQRADEAIELSVWLQRDPPFDGDTFLQHNAFRSPGAPSIEELKAKPGKVAYLQGIYAKMRRGIVVHPEYLDTENIELLRDMQLVFLCFDGGTAKR
jgi:hypothetical protein